ncbi:MAG TPA: class I SAM-dependent methyltransferase [Bryobacteraceae bacterium]|nr:class I SAM-dependent methyltransferase [Bryobacteraceae bacterium]
MENPYNQVPYVSAAFPQAHVHRLASHAVLNGLNPPDVRACRVLELGCNDGAHLIPMALAHPESQFVGIDVAETPIARAQETAAELGLENISFRVADVLQLSGQPGECDYLIAHGLYSWVDSAVQEKVLELCGRLLAERGVGYVSYNCYPAWHIREMTRNMTRIHTEGVTDPNEIHSRCIALLAGIYRSQSDREPYRETIRAEMDRLLAKDPVLCFHDDFGPVNSPVYFREFIRRASNYGLQFLSEAEPSDMQSTDFAPDTREALGSIDDVVEREQFYDLLTLRGFRRTLLCRGDLILSRRADVEAMRKLHFAAAIQYTATPDLTSMAGADFNTTAGATITVTQPFVKAVLYALAETWPASLSFDELLGIGLAAGAQEEGTDSQAMLREVLLRMNLPGVMDMSPVPWAGPRTVSDRPVASKLAVYQLRSGPKVTSLRHRSVDLDDDLGKAILPLLDGQRTAADVLQSVASTDGASAESVNASIARLYKLGLICG